MKLRLMISLALAVTAFGADPTLIKRNPRPLQAESDLSALVPWETPIDGFFIRSHHEVPVLDDETFTVVIDGLVEHPLTLRLKDLRELPQRSLHAVLECSGNGRSLHKPNVSGVQWERGAVGNAEWTGVSVAGLLAKAGVKAEARFARVEGADKPAMPGVPPFIRSIPVEKMRDKDTILAINMNREPMPRLHGGPLRLILPNWYGQNWIKWVAHITLTEKEDSGFYMKKAYRMPRKPVKPGEKWDSATGVPIEQLLVQSVIVSPRPGGAVGRGTIAVSGKAFSGAGTIAKVEVSRDQGKHWTLAKVEPPRPDGGWQEFSADVPAKKIETVTLLARATDSAGNSQPILPQWNPSGYLRNWADRVTVRVLKTAPSVADALFEEKCLTCHTREMAMSQRLTPEGWEKAVAKMETVNGLKLTPEEHAEIVKYASEQWPADLAPAQPPRTDYASEAELVQPHDLAGKASRGAALYAATCAACHGPDAEGKTGPRLKGRFVTNATFWSAVQKGRHAMPSFETLADQQVADLRAYLNQPE